MSDEPDIPADDLAEPHHAPQGRDPLPEPRTVDQDDEAGVPERHTPVTQQLGRIVLLALAVLFVVFALANAQYVDFSWIFGATEVVQQAGERVEGGVRLIFLLGGAFAIGAILGGFLDHLRHRKRDRARHGRG